MKQSDAEILCSYGPFPDVQSVHGVTFDGEHVWFASGDRLHALDPESGRIHAALEVAAHAGTAFDGTHIYQIADGLIQKIDRATGEVLSAIPAPGVDDASGLAWAEGLLWVGQHHGRKIHQVDPETGRVLRTIESERFVTGVTWVEARLWHGTWENETCDLRCVELESGTVVEVLDMPGGIGVSGLATDSGDRLFCGGGGSGEVRVIRRPRTVSG